MKVLITGGAGYLGAAIVKDLLEHEQVEEIIIYDNLSRANYNVFLAFGEKHPYRNKVRFVHGDILDSRRLGSVLKQVQFVIHAAAKVTTPFADHHPHEFDQINHWGTAELTYQVEQSNVQKLVFLSSISVYGSSSEEVDINTNPNPRTFYGISKLRAEEQIAALEGKCKFLVLRCGNVFGYADTMRFDAVINRFAFDAHFKRRISVNGTGDQIRPFVSLRSASAAISSSLFDNTEGKMNLVDRNLSINEIAEALKHQYADLEILSVNQDIQMRSLKVKPSINSNINLEQELQDLTAAFAW
ncbi:MAG: NAD-dependent epimerase/dehydratase family protein [Flavobacteriales bacterium]|nr:NAD-dependent epimerase/dehydratase family protein [Flavobacteriales bacterium]